MNTGKKEKPAKPKYGMWQNSWCMVKLAWTTGEKKVPVMGLLLALLTVATNLLNLTISPAILAAVERRVSVAELVGTIAAFVLALMLVAAATEYIQNNVLYGRISVRMEWIARLHKKAATTSYPNLFDEAYQKMNAKAQDCVCSNRASTEAIWTTLTDLTANILGFLVYAALLCTVQPLLLVVVLATTALSYFVGNFANEWGYRHREEEAEAEKQMSYLARRAWDLTAAKDIRIFGLRPWLEQLHGKAMAAYRAFHKRAQGVYLWAGIVDLLLTFARNAVAYAYLIGLVLRNGLGVSEFLLYFSAVSGFTTWVSGILDGAHTLHKQSLEISTVRECLEYPEPFRFASGAPIAPEEGKDYELRLDDVSFRYPGATADTLSHICLRLRPGEKLAVVGLNGAGKTTLVKLLCGFLDPTEGRVLLNGRDIREFNRADYYSLFSAVFQDFTVLADSVAVNVAQRGEGVDMARVRECIEKAGLRGKIESLPDGYDTKLNREVYEQAVQLSGGETQRLMLARALYKDAPFVVLDEPTAALDPIAEADMYRRYDDLTGGKSSIFISHRLASTRFCDRILMLSGGCIAEEGTHEELLQRQGEYAALFEVQSRYYKEGAEPNEKE